MSDTVHWSQIRGNVFLTKPNPQMLSTHGDAIPVRNARLRGVSSHDKKTREVHFDRGYVVEYLKRAVLNPLNIQTKENLEFLQGLINEAFNQSESGATESENEKS